MTGTVDWKTISDIAEEYLYNTTADDDDDAHNPQRGMVPIETERRETKETILEATATTTTAMAGGRNTQSPVRQQQQQKKEGSEEARIDEIFQQQKQQWRWLSGQERKRTNDPPDRQQEQQWRWQCRWLWDQQQNLIPNDRPYQCSIPLSLYNYTESNDKDNDKDVRRVTPHPDEEIDPNVIRPGPNDVLFRSGKNHSSHPGNAVFYKMIQARYDEHVQSHQDEKAVISQSVVDEIEERGGRFLIWDYNTPKVRYVRKKLQKKKRPLDSWLVIEDSVTRREKVASYFRLYRRRLLDAKKRKVLSVEEVKKKRRYENVMKEFREELVALKKAEAAKKAELVVLKKAAEFKKLKNAAEFKKANNATAKTGTAV